jgi:hypothetical protein
VVDYRNPVSLLEVAHNLAEGLALVLQSEPHSCHCRSLVDQERSLGSFASALEGTAVVVVVGEHRSPDGPAADTADHNRACLPPRRIGPRSRRRHSFDSSQVHPGGAARSHHSDPHMAEVGFAVDRVVGLVEPELHGELVD